MGCGHVKESFVPVRAAIEDVQEIDRNIPLAPTNAHRGIENIGLRDDDRLKAVQRKLTFVEHIALNEETVVERVSCDSPDDVVGNSRHLAKALIAVRNVYGE